MRFSKTDSIADQSNHAAALPAAQNARQQQISVSDTLTLFIQSVTILLFFISPLALADKQTGTQTNTPVNPKVIDLLPDTQPTPQPESQTTIQAKPAGTEPTPFTAKYKVTKGIMSVGSTKRTLKDEGNGYYVFESVTEPGGIAKLFTTGKVVERSFWRFQNNKLVPHEYTYTNSGDQKRDVKLEFDWDNYKVTNIINGDPWTMDIAEETLDKLNYQLAIMYDLSQGKNKLLYQVADGGKMKTYDIKIEGEVRLVTELGTFNTLKIVRSTENRTTIMWCAKELQYLPVKIEQKKKDGSVTAELVDVSGIPYTSKQKQKPVK